MKIYIIYLDAKNRFYACFIHYQNIILLFSKSIFMKKILITCLFCSGFLWGNAQIIVDKKDINKDTTINTIMVCLVEGKGVLSDFYASIDYGQGFFRLDNVHGVVKILTVFEENGWDLQHFSIINTNNNGIDYREFYYLFRRKK